MCRSCFGFYPVLSFGFSLLLGYGNLIAENSVFFHLTMPTNSTHIGETVHRVFFCSTVTFCLISNSITDSSKSISKIKNCRKGILAKNPQPSTTRELSLILYISRIRHSTAKCIYSHSHEIIPECSREFELWQPFAYHRTLLIFCFESC